MKLYDIGMRWDRTRIEAGNETRSMWRLLD